MDPSCSEHIKNKNKRIKTGDFSGFNSVHGVESSILPVGDQAISSCNRFDPSGGKILDQVQVTDFAGFVETG